MNLDAQNLPEQYDPGWFHPDIFEREEQFRSAYRELRSIARYLLRGEAYSPTLETTELVNEAFLKLYISPMGFNDRGHVIAVLSRYMRQVLIDRARRKGAKKRDGEKVDLEIEAMASQLDADQWRIVGETLEQLATTEPLLARVFDMHYFAGLQLKEIAPLLGRSERSVKRYWQAARLWLRDRLRSEDDPSPEIG